MTHHDLKQLAITAVRTLDPRLAGQVVDHCRFKLGFNYVQTCELVREWTGVDIATWDALLAESEEE